MSEDLEGVVYRALAEPVQYPSGDGLTFEGYAAVFNQRAHISDHLGEYDEVIKPGAFKRTLAARTPQFFFQHGRHPTIGEYPLGRLEVLREDEHGLFVRARLTDNWMVSPITDAIENRAITGMSVAMLSPAGKATFTNERDGTRLRTVSEAKLYELGPVVAPAYVGTEASVRSILHGLEHQFPTEVAQERLDLYARIAILEERQSQEISDTSEELAETRTSDEPVDDTPGTSETEPADETDAQPRAPMTASERAAYVRRVEMDKRGIRAKG